MYHEQCKVAAKVLDNLLTQKFGEQHAPYRDDNGKAIGHLRWMLAEIMGTSLAENKSMRWLGYVQGMMVGYYHFPLEQMKKVNKEAVYGTEED